MLCNIFYKISDPLEQFSNLTLISEQYNCPTNLLVSTQTFLIENILIFSIIGSLFVCSYKKNVISFILENVELFVKTLLEDNSRTIKNSHLMGYLFMFILILIINLSGLVPFSWTITSWFTPVLLLGGSFFYQINVFLFLKKKYFFFSQFVPAGTPLVIIPFLTLIELISYISRIISLSVRLFANMLSGHALLKILISFSYAILKNLTISGVILAFAIWFGVTIIFVLEIMVALLQAYVFTLLLNIYFNDVFADEH